MLKYEDDYEEFDIEIPEEILVIDPSYPHYFNKVVRLHLGPPWKGSDLTVFHINDGGDWFWPSDIVALQYVDYQRVKHLKAFL